MMPGPFANRRRNGLEPSGELVETKSMSPRFHTFPNLVLRGVFGLIGACLLTLVGVAQNSERESASASKLTSLDDFWLLSTTERDQAQPIDLDFEVLFYDPEWQVLHVRNDSIAEYIFPSEILPIRAGDQVSVTGYTNPMQNTFSIGKATWEVRGNTQLEGTRIDPGQVNHQEWIDRLVRIEGLVESQELLDAKHLELRLISGGQQVAIWVMLNPEEPVPQLEGTIVSLTGVYAPKFENNGEVDQLEVFCASSEWIELISRLENYLKFETPALAIENVKNTLSDSDLIRVVGRRIGPMESGAFWLRDETGQIRIEIGQRRAPDSDVNIEVIGRPVVDGIERRLTHGLWRRIPGSNGGESMVSGRVLLHRLAATVMELSLAQAAQDHPVEITGVVTWSQPNVNRLFVQDSSGGVGVAWPFELGPVPAPGQMMKITGVTQVGGFAPMVKAEMAEDEGSVYFPRAESISWEQAMLGTAEAQWVKMTGFVFAAQREGGSARLNISTASGELIARLSSISEVSQLVGSVVMITGVCVVDADDDRSLRGIELWVPGIEVVEVLDSGETDHFALTAIPLAELDRFDSTRSFHERVRTEGSVLHWDDNGRIYVGNGEMGIRVHSRQLQPLRRGDRVELVGFQGRDGNHPILREAMYQVIGSIDVIPSSRFIDGDDLSKVEDGALIEIEGSLVERIDFGTETHFALRNGAEVFVVEISQSREDRMQKLPPLGSFLRVTGVGVLNYDDQGNRMGFRILANSPRDVELLRAQGWWTPRRVTLVVSSLIGLVLISLLWIRSLRRRVWMQTIKIEQQMQRASELEADLQRTSRMDSLGSLAEGIARDFDGLLDRVKIQTTQVLDQERLSIEGRRGLDQARAALLRAQDLTKRLSSLSLARKPELESLDLAAFLRREVDAFEAGPSVKIIWQIPDSVPEIPADRAQLREVIYNLMLNAVQAMSRGGTIKVKLNPVSITADDAESMLPMGAYLKLTVRDSGDGITASNLDRVFDPYFTTRPAAKGLGLSVVYAIVRQHSGRVVVESSPMAGTEVMIWFRIKTDDWTNPPY